MNQLLTAVLCLVAAVCLHPPAAVAGEGPQPGDSDVTILVDTDTAAGQLYNFWNVFPVTVQAPFKDDEKHVQLRRTCPFAKYINCVRFLGGIKQKKMTTSGVLTQTAKRSAILAKP